MQWLTEPSLRTTVVCVGYLACLGMALWGALLGRRLNQSTAVTFWMTITVITAALGAVRYFQADLLATEWLRSGAKSQGWYTSRRPVQAVVMGIALSLVLAGALRVVRLKSNPTVTFASLAAFVLSVLFLSNLVSFHFVDVWMARQWGPVSARNVVEVSSLAVLAAAAAVEVVRRRQELRIETQVARLAHYLTLLDGHRACRDSHR